MAGATERRHPHRRAWGEGVATVNNSALGRQVTYAGHPLYLYSGDSSPADTSYVGVQQFGGKWYALNAAGHLVK
jgi:hypothetical protein